MQLSSENISFKISEIEDKPPTLMSMEKFPHSTDRRNNFLVGSK